MNFETHILVTILAKSDALALAGRRSDLASGVSLAADDAVVRALHRLERRAMVEPSTITTNDTAALRLTALGQDRARSLCGLPLLTDALTLAADAMLACLELEPPISTGSWMPDSALVDYCDAGTVIETSLPGIVAGYLEMKIEAGQTFVRVTDAGMDKIVDRMLAASKGDAFPEPRRRIRGESFVLYSHQRDAAILTA